MDLAWPCPRRGLSLHRGMQKAGVLACDRLQPVPRHVAISNALVPAATHPRHRHAQTLRHGAYRDAMATHQAAEGRATEIKHGASLLAAVGRHEAPPCVVNTWAPTSPLPHHTA